MIESNRSVTTQSWLVELVKSDQVESACMFVILSKLRQGYSLIELVGSLEIACEIDLNFTIFVLLSAYNLEVLDIVFIDKFRPRSTPHILLY